MEPLSGSWQAPELPAWRKRNFTAEAAEIFARHQGGMARSLQREIGPSEIGHPCDRHLGYKLVHEPPINVDGLKWAAWLGTAAHHAAEEAMTLENERLGRERYLIEHETEIDVEAGVPKAHTDIYDTDANEVIDWKFPGDSTLDKCRAKGEPSNLYVVQVQTYALGWAKRGYTVESVRLVMLPRASSDIMGGFEWAMPYNPSIATRALERVSTLRAAATIIKGGLSEWGELAANTDDCRFCPWRNAGKVDEVPRGNSGEPANMAGCIGYHKPRVDLGELGGVPSGPPPTRGETLARLIADAQHPDALVGLWREAKAQGIWTEAHTRAAAKRKSELLT